MTGHSCVHLFSDFHADLVAFCRCGMDASENVAEGLTAAAFRGRRAPQATKRFGGSFDELSDAQRRQQQEGRVAAAFDDDEWQAAADDDRVYKVRRLRAHKTIKGKLFYECIFANPKFFPEWLPEDNISDDLIEAYQSKIGVRACMQVTCDMWPLVAHVRRSVGHAVALAKHACRPMQHELQVEALCLEPLAKAFLQLCTQPHTLRPALRDAKDFQSAGRALPVHVTKEADGSFSWEVNYTLVEQIGHFCSFQEFFPDKALGCLRYDIGRASNEDLMVVAPRMRFLATQTKRTTGCVSFTLEFSTVHINGLFGTPTPPHACRGLIKKASTIESVLTYVRAFIPRSHGLVTKGWKALPAGQWELPDEVAVPTTEDDAGGVLPIFKWALKALKLDAMPSQESMVEIVNSLNKEGGTAHEMKAASILRKNVLESMQSEP